MQVEAGPDVGSGRLRRRTSRRAHGRREAGVHHRVIQHGRDMDMLPIVKNVLLLIVALATSAGAFAQTPASRVVNEKDLNESTVIDALKPQEDDDLTRQIVIRPRGEAQPPRAPQPVKKNELAMLITFATNSAELTQQAKAALDRVGAALKSPQLAEFDFVVEGHADPRGNREANMTLSEARAAAVAEYLVSAHQIASGRLRNVGKGDTEPLVPTNPAAPENRRVTLRTLVK